MVVTNTERVLAILGPTCTGKSDLGIKLARTFHGEIVNADSMQVYRHFDIGSAKPALEVRAAVPHHLVDVVQPDEEFNAALFKKLADSAIKETWERGALPVVVGGTGLYIRALFHGLFVLGKDPAVREEIRKRYDEDPLAVYEELKRVDREYAMRISFRDRLRVVRALEVHGVSGKNMTQWQEEHDFREERYCVLKIGLTQMRPELYERINRRVEAMLEAGWEDEVRKLLERFPPAVKPFGGIGYKEILLFLSGALGREKMVELIKKNTRHYAKRQLTWFAGERNIEWFRYPEDLAAITKRVEEFLS